MGSKGRSASCDQWDQATIRDKNQKEQLAVVWPQSVILYCTKSTYLYGRIIYDLGVVWEEINNQDLTTHKGIVGGR